MSISIGVLYSFSFFSSIASDYALLTTVKWFLFEVILLAKSVDVRFYFLLVLVA
jgi:hypothetical protein